MYVEVIVILENGEKFFVKCVELNGYWRKLLIDESLKKKFLINLRLFFEY